ncbi:MAG: class I SAM-dependent methyltransferase [Candidatus Omnitrophica bacterium]|nr:class I SAM-dependent methyltransferase [Candidatus Omnitrophota bacterium]
MRYLTDRIQHTYAMIPKCNYLLDIGGGDGFAAKYYFKKAKSVYVIDKDKKAIQRGKKQNTKIVFRCALAEKMPFKNKFFDVVVITDAFEHVNDEKKTIEEIYRVLKKRGTMVMSVPHKGLFSFIDPFNFKFMFPWLYKLIKGKKEYEKVIKIEPNWHRHYSLKDLKRLFKDRFKIKKVHRGGLLLWPLLWLLNDLILVPIWHYNPPKIVSKIYNLLSKLDYNINYGPLAYHIIIKAEKI